MSVAPTGLIIFMVPIYRGSAYGCTPAYSHTPLTGLCGQGKPCPYMNRIDGQGMRCQYSYFLTIFWPLTM